MSINRGKARNGSGVKMIKIAEFEPQLAERLPDTHRLLKVANLVVHAAVSRMVIHGSRGLGGSYRDDSDLDLSLLVRATEVSDERKREKLLRCVLETTLGHWQSPVEADLAAVFDVRGCGLRCFDQEQYDEGLCALGGIDCFGLYKIQKGFDGFVTGMGLEVRRIFPCLTIWRNRILDP